MPKLVVPIALLMALVVIPTVDSAAPLSDCSRLPPQEETARYPLRGGTYILIVDPRDDENSGKSGFWQEQNGVDHLQTEACAPNGDVLYGADKYLGLALP